MSHRAAELLAVLLVASLLAVVWWADSAEAAVRADSAPPKATEQPDDPLAPYRPFLSQWESKRHGSSPHVTGRPLHPPPPCEASSGLTPDANRRLGKCLMLTYNHISMLEGDYAGWHDPVQWSCLDRLWSHESGWWQHAANPRSSAHGIPQALPGSKMGDGWAEDVTVQVWYGLTYLDARYGTPCAANAHSLRHNWY